MKATIFFHDVPTQGENLVEIEFTAEPVWAAAAPTQPAGELRDKIESIVQWASTKTPCGDNYQCLLSDLQAALGREGK